MFWQAQKRIPAPLPTPYVLLHTKANARLVALLVALGRAIRTVIDTCATHN